MYVSINWIDRYSGLNAVTDTSVYRYLVSQRSTVKNVRSCVLRTFLKRDCISKILHRISFPLKNLGFTMPIELYLIKNLR